MNKFRILDSILLWLVIQAFFLALYRVEVFESLIITMLPTIIYWSMVALLFIFVLIGYKYIKYGSKRWFRKRGH